MFEYEIANFRRNELIREAAEHRLAEEAKAGRRSRKAARAVPAAGVTADRRRFARAA